MGSLMSKSESIEDIDPEVLAFVDMTLANEKLNMKCIPDSIERKFYAKITQYAINAIRNVLSTVQIHFINHKLTFNIEPISNGEFQV